MFSNPKQVIDQCGIQVGMTIADFGAGSGAYVIEAGRALMATGRVYAVDVQKDLLAKVLNDVRTAGLSNVEIIQADVEVPGGTRLRDASVDLVLMCNVLFQMDDRASALSEAKRILVPGGRVLVVDWTASHGGVGPHPQRVFGKSSAVELFEHAGFVQDREVSAGAHHYGFIFKKL